MSNWLKSPITANGKTYPAGTQFIPAKAGDACQASKHGAERSDSLSMHWPPKPEGEAFTLRPPRIALWDRYGGSVPSGWTRYVHGRNLSFRTPSSFQDGIEKDDLAQHFDVLILVD